MHTLHIGLQSTFTKYAKLSYYTLFYLSITPCIACILIFTTLKFTFSKTSNYINLLYLSITPCIYLESLSAVHFHKNIKLSVVLYIVLLYTMHILHFYSSAVHLNKTIQPSIVIKRFLVNITISYNVENHGVLQAVRTITASLTLSFI